MKKKGFTLVELLVVIAIIALLMGILMPALARVRAIAFRMVCGSTLSGIGKAMIIYANDYEDEFPRAGLKGNKLALTTLINDWAAADRETAFSTRNVTVSSCFYLLIKYTEVTPKSFICKGDTGTSEFKLSESGLTAAQLALLELVNLWDFGGPPSDNPAKHCSYSYHQPLPSAVDTAYNYALTTSSDPGMAVAADRNPWLTTAGGNWANFKVPEESGTVEQQIEGNSASHGKEGQNVLFMDSHVYFEKRAYCGVNDDNIYTSWSALTNPTPTQMKHGNAPPPTGTFAPVKKADSLLLNSKL